MAEGEKAALMHTASTTQTCGFRLPSSCVDVPRGSDPLWMQEIMNKVLYDTAYGVSFGAVKCWDLTAGE